MNLDLNSQNKESHAKNNQHIPSAPVKRNMQRLRELLLLSSKLFFFEHVPEDSMAVRYNDTFQYIRPPQVIPIYIL